MEKLAKYAEDNGYFWSCGTHQEWKYDARVWTYYLDKRGKRHIPTNIGFGNTLEEAIEMCLSKPKFIFNK